RMMSSRLGLVAEVMATESPSQLNPVVIHRTCAVTASASFCIAYGIPNADIPSPLAQNTCSTDPRQRVPHQLVHNPLAAKARLHQHLPGRLRTHLADLSRCLAPGHRA